MTDTVRPGAVRLRAGLAILFLALFVAGALGRAHTRPLWHDELYTWHVANQPGISAIWQSLQTGVDLNPPLYYLLVQQAAALVPSDRIAVRLPSILGFALMLATLGAFVRMRCGSAVGGAAAALVTLSGVGAYAYEGRPYGFVLGCAGLALFAWQQAASAERRRGGWVLLFALALALALASHYYAVLLVVPFAVGELVRVLRLRRLDLPVAAAIVSSLGTLWLWRPLIDVARNWSASFWSRPSLTSPLDAYHTMLSTLGWPLVACLVPVAALAGLVRSGWLPPARTPRGRSGMPGHELAALAAFAALPLAGVALSFAVTGAWHERYVLPAIIGIAGLAAAGAHASGTLALRCFTVVLMLAFVAQSAGRLREWREAPRRPDAVSIVEDHVALDDPAPLLVSDGLAFVELAYYLPPALASRLVYGLKPASVIARTGTDTMNRALEQLARLTPLNLARFHVFVTRNERFSVLGRPTWVTEELQARGVPLRVVADGGDFRVLDVTQVRIPAAHDEPPARTER